MPTMISKLTVLSALIAVAVPNVCAQAQNVPPGGAQRAPVLLQRPPSVQRVPDGPVKRIPELRQDPSAIGKTPEQLFPSTAARRVVTRPDQQRRAIPTAPIKFLPLIPPSVQVGALPQPDMTGWVMLTTGAIKGDVQVVEIGKKIVLARGADSLVRGALINPGVSGPLPAEAWKFLLHASAGSDSFGCAKSSPQYFAKYIACAFSFPNGKTVLQYYRYRDDEDVFYYGRYNPVLELDGLPGGANQPFFIGATIGVEALYNSSDYDEESQKLGFPSDSYSHIVTNHGEVLAAWDGQDRLWLRKRRWFADFKFGFDTGFNTDVPRPDGPDQWVKSPFYLFGPMRCAGDAEPVYCTAGRALPGAEMIQLFSNVVKHDYQPLPSWTNLPKAPPMIGGAGFDKAGIAIALLSDGRLLLAARSAFGALQSVIYDPKTQQYSAWRREGGSIAPGSTPACTVADGKAVCFVKAPDGRVWQKVIAPR